MRRMVRGTLAAFSRRMRVKYARHRTPTTVSSVYEQTCKDNKNAAQVPEAALLIRLPRAKARISTLLTLRTIRHLNMSQ